MADKLIKFALNNRFTVLILFLMVFVIGIFSVKNLPIDAFPDVSPKLVRVFVEVNATAAEEVERLVTTPIEREMKKVKGVKRVKSVSSYGLSTIRIYFDDSMDINLARQLVNEKIKIAEEQIPDFLDIPHGIEMGAISSGTGKIMAYYLENRDSSLIDLRTLHDSTIKPFLENVNGVSEILSQGGFVKQFKIDIDSKKLNIYNLTILDIIEKVKKSSLNIGAGLTKVEAEEWIVRSLGRIENIKELKSVFIKKHNNRNIFLKDVANVHIGKAERRGVASINGEKEIVTGSVYKSPNSNSFAIISNLKKKIQKINKRLPNGIKIKTYYDQGDLVKKSIDTVQNALVLGLILVSFISMVFLRKIKNILLVILSIPFSMFFSFTVLKIVGLSGDLISLGGLAIGLGMIVDASIIMIEKIYYNMQHMHEESDITEIIKDSYSQVARPIIFSISIIIFVFLPIWTLTGVEGKMFKPQVISITVAMFASLIYALVVIPAIYSFWKRKKDLHKHQEKKERLIIRSYKSTLNFLINKKKSVAIFFIISLIFGGILFKKIGKVFMPILEEGTIHVVAHMDPNISLEEISKISKELEKEVITLDEVKYAVTDIGYGDVGPHVHHTNYASLTVGFKSKDQWKDAKSQNDLIQKIYDKLIFFPANSISFTQPIQHEVDDLIAGSGSQVVIKIFGQDMNNLKTIGEKIKGVISSIKGAKDIYLDQISGQTQLKINIDREKLAKYNIEMTEAQNIINSSIGGTRAGKIFTKEDVFDISVRLDENSRKKIENVLIKKIGNQQIRIKDIANIDKVTGLMQIRREEGNRYINVQCNVRGRDIGSFIKEAQSKVAKVDMPLTNYITWGGQFELQQKADKRFQVVIPITLFIVTLLLFRFHGNLKEMILIFLNIPFSILGGISALYLFKQNLSIPSTIGFIALFGIALQDALVLINRFKYLREKGETLKDAIINGAVSKLRPVIMTTLTTALGLIPLVLSTGVGSEIQKPLALVVIGGLISSTLLTLFIIPTFYSWMFEEK